MTFRDITDGKHGRMQSQPFDFETYIEEISGKEK